LKKRDKKNNSKRGIGGEIPEKTDDPSDIRPIVTQIFNPAP